DEACRPLFSGAAGKRAELAYVQAQLGHCAIPLVFDRRAENERFVGFQRQPTVLLDLSIELTSPPAGVPKGQKTAPRPLTRRHVPENVDRCGQGDLVVHPQGRFLEVIRRVEHKSSGRLYRPTEMNPDLLPKAAEIDAELRKEVREIDRIYQAIQNQAHGPLFVVGADIDQGSFEAGVSDRRHGRQELTAEVAFMHVTLLSHGFISTFPVQTVPNIPPVPTIPRMAGPGWAAGRCLLLHRISSY